MNDPVMPEVLWNMLSQSPLALAGIYVSHLFMSKHEKAMQKLIETFEKEVQACEARYQMVWEELMKLKERVK